MCVCVCVTKCVVYLNVPVFICLTVMAVCLGVKFDL